MDSSQRGGQQLVIIKQRCSLCDWTAGRLVTVFAEAIVPDVGNYLQIDDGHLLWRKFSSSLASLIWGQGGRGKKEWPFPDTPWWGSNQKWPRGQVKLARWEPAHLLQLSFLCQKPKKGPQGAGGKTEKLRRHLIQTGEAQSSARSAPSAGRPW